MLRGIWTQIVLVLVTAALAFPVVVIVPIVPRWADLILVLGRVWARVMLRTVGARVRYHGLERATATAPCVFIANHQSSIDIWALLRVVPISTRFVAKRELFRIPVLGWALAASGFIAVDRAHRSEALRSLDRAAERIRAGRPVVLFPEGTRSRDGRLQPFKKGAFYLALRAGVPIVPVAIRGSFAVQPPGSWRVRPGPVDVFFEPPIEVTRFQPDRQAELLAEVRGMITRRLEAPPAGRP